jgi:magnesium chelatase family protein
MSTQTKIFSATTLGVDSHIVEVEVDLSLGMLEFHIVGLPDAAIKESRRRIRTALRNSGLAIPERKIIVNLAPADLKKEGASFDLPIALGIIHAAGLIPSTPWLTTALIAGELSLDGSIRGVKGILPIASDAQRHGKTILVIPKENVHEAAVIEGITVYGVSSLTQLVTWLRNEAVIEPTSHYLPTTITASSDLDLNQIKGQQQAKRALQIAAAGRHNILFIGPPGGGKTMLAQRLPTLMPAMTTTEIIETSKLYSISGKLGNQHLIQQRPFQAPHHTITSAGLVGGGAVPQPGALSLAHHGVLFLDEITEFKRATLEALRQPLENRTVSIARVQNSIVFPAHALLIAATNPCPCGFFGDQKRRCICTPQQVNSYLQKLSGPLLDRIDLQVAVQAVSYEALKTSPTQEKSSSELAQPITQAIARQKKRGYSNNGLPASAVEKFCILTPPAEQLVKQAFDKLNLTMRGYHKLLKVARTIADLAEQPTIDVAHVQEALMYRSLDQYFQRPL